MASDAWNEIRPQFEKALGAASCEAAYDERNREAFAGWFTSVDDEVRENGVSDDLLARLAGEAKGQFILLVTQTAATPRAPISATPDEPKAKARSSGSQRPSGMESFQGRSPSFPSSMKDPLEMSAVLYSTQRREVVREIEMKYTGDDQHEAVRQFVMRLAAEMAGMTCKGWALGKAPAQPSIAPAAPISSVAP